MSLRFLRFYLEWINFNLVPKNIIFEDITHKTSVYNSINIHNSINKLALKP